MKTDNLWSAQMTTTFPNCWEIKNCGRQKGGTKVAELGECIAPKEKMGHSCWAIAGTLCGGVVQGAFAQKLTTCMTCSVFKNYNRNCGVYRNEVAAAFPDEANRYIGALRDVRQRKAQTRATSR
jgi:hypothetical protein